MRAPAKKNNIEQAQDEALYGLFFDFYGESIAILENQIGDQNTISKLHDPSHLYAIHQESTYTYSEDNSNIDTESHNFHKVYKQNVESTYGREVYVPIENTGTVAVFYPKTNSLAQKNLPFYRAARPYLVSLFYNRLNRNTGYHSSWNDLDCYHAEYGLTRTIDNILDKPAQYTSYNYVGTLSKLKKTNQGEGPEKSLHGFFEELSSLLTKCQIYASQLGVSELEGKDADSIENYLSDVTLNYLGIELSILVVRERIGTLDISSEKKAELTEKLNALEVSLLKFHSNVKRKALEKITQNPQTNKNIRILRMLDNKENILDSYLDTILQQANEYLVGKNEQDKWNVLDEKFLHANFIVKAITLFRKNEKEYREGSFFLVNRTYLFKFLTAIALKNDPKSELGRILSVFYRHEIFSDRRIPKGNSHNAFQEKLTKIESDLVTARNQKVQEENKKTKKFLPNSLKYQQSSLIIGSSVPLIPEKYKNKKIWSNEDFPHAAKGKMSLQDFFDDYLSVIQAKLENYLEKYKSHEDIADKKVFYARSIIHAIESFQKYERENPQSNLLAQNREALLRYLIVIAAENQANGRLGEVLSIFYEQHKILEQHVKVTFPAFGKSQKVISFKGDLANVMKQGQNRLVNERNQLLKEKNIIWHMMHLGFDQSESKSLIDKRVGSETDNQAEEALNQFIDFNCAYHSSGSVIHVLEEINSRGSINSRYQKLVEIAFNLQKLFAQYSEKQFSFNDFNEKIQAEIEKIGSLQAGSFGQYPKQLQDLAEKLKKDAHYQNSLISVENSYEEQEQFIAKLYNSPLRKDILEPQEALSEQQLFSDKIKEKISAYYQFIDAEKDKISGTVDPNISIFYKREIFIFLLSKISELQIEDKNRTVNTIDEGLDAVVNFFETNQLLEVDCFSRYILLSKLKLIELIINDENIEENDERKTMAQARIEEILELAKTLPMSAVDSTSLGINKFHLNETSGSESDDTDSRIGLEEAFMKRSGSTVINALNMTTDLNNVEIEGNSNLKSVGGNSIAIQAFVYDTRNTVLANNSKAYQEKPVSGLVASM